MKNLFILFLLIFATPAWGQNIKVTDGPGGWFRDGNRIYTQNPDDKVFGIFSGNFEGAGGCIGNCGFDIITATTGKFSNISTRYLNVESDDTMLIRARSGGGDRFTVNNLGQSAFQFGGNRMEIQPNFGLFRFIGPDPLLQVFGTNRSWAIQNNNGYTVADTYLTFLPGVINNATGDHLGLNFKPIYSQTGDAGYTSLFINLSTVTSGSGEKNFVKASNNNNVKFILGVDGSIQTHGGLKTAYRNLSSVTETVLTTDYFITCLPNDNPVTLNLPPIDLNLSQTLMVINIDPGSTNKCYLDGNLSEQVQGFNIFSGLTNYKDGIVLKSNGVGWWGFQ